MVRFSLWYVPARLSGFAQRRERRRLQHLAQSQIAAAERASAPPPMPAKNTHGDACS